MQTRPWGYRSHRCLKPQGLSKCRTRANFFTCASYWCGFGRTAKDCYPDCLRAVYWLGAAWRRSPLLSPNLRISPHQYRADTSYFPILILPPIRPDEASPTELARAVIVHLHPVPKLGSALNDVNPILPDGDWLPRAKPSRQLRIVFFQFLDRPLRYLLNAASIVVSPFPLQ